jgi:hypothetical protein
MPEAVRALFEPDREYFVPTELARGPWDPAALHGGPPAALIGRALEALAAPGPMAWVRVTLELLRPVPLAPLRVGARLARGGRRVQLATATLQAADGTELCRASAWRIRRAEAPVAEPPEVEPPPGDPEAARLVALPEGFDPRPMFSRHGIEARWVAGDWALGPATVWMRLRAPVVAGELPTPLQRTLALADFGNGVSAALPWTTHVFINPDLTLYLEREAEGEWLALDAVTRFDPDGAGVAESVLSDRRGRVGRALQGLYIARR